MGKDSSGQRRDPRAERRRLHHEAARGDAPLSDEPLTDLRIGVNTQTPLVRFQGDPAVQGRLHRLSDLEEGTDYEMSTGGVTRMLLPLLKHWMRSDTLADVTWVSLGSDERSLVLDHGGVALSYVGLTDAERQGYAIAKEWIWALLTANPSMPVPHSEGSIPESAWIAFDRYQRLTAKALEDAARRMDGIDLLYIHDFQQIGVAESWRGPAVPKVFHLHAPFPPMHPGGWTDYLVARLQRYDAIIVSTQQYADNLRNAGVTAPIAVLPPFIDPAEYRTATDEDVQRFRKQYGVREDEEVILNVGRMDPIKGQDRLIRAMPLVLQSVPSARLVLVGGGGFSSSRSGLGLAKAERWRERLERLAAHLGVTDHVTFTGHLSDRMLPAAYEACDVFCLPSPREGFGLAAVEAWWHEKPIVACESTGVSEIMQDGVHGRSIDASDIECVAEAIVDLLTDEQAAAKGRAGREVSRIATLDVGARALERILSGVLHARDE